MYEKGRVFFFFVKGWMFLRFESASVLTLLVLCLQKEEDNNFLLVELAALYSNV